MKKRAEATLWFLIEAVGALFIGYLAVNLSLQITQGSIYEKLNVAKDLALELDALRSVPGDAYIINSNTHGFSIAITGNKIEVFEFQSEPYKGVYYFVEGKETQSDVRLEKPKQIVLSKINNNIRVSEEIPS